MKNKLNLVILLTVLAACSNSENHQEENSSSETPQTIVAIQDENTYYVGKFHNPIAENESDKGLNDFNKISIVIESIKDTLVQGYSVVAGNKRPFTGKAELVDSNYFRIWADEPGDHRHDGRFDFMYAPGASITGNWKAFDEKVKNNIKEYTLRAKNYEYQPSQQLSQQDLNINLYDKDEDYAWEPLSTQVLYYNASTDTLREEYMIEVFKGDLEVIRNAVYARHGYSFKNRRMRAFFDRVEWYIPRSVDVRKELTPLEVQNIELLKRIQDYADVYYDDFGR